jgi:quinol monooxygenase YgiN
MPPLVVIAEAEIETADMDRLRDAGRRMVEASRKEPGCITYAYSFDMLQPNRMRAIEVWTSEAALREHFTTPHMAAFRRELAALQVRIVSLTVHELGKEGRLPA